MIKLPKPRWKIAKKPDIFEMTLEQTIVFAIIVGICAFFGAYIREKGKNFATKEDVALITRKQEEIKTELGNRGHYNRIRYERETEIYRNVWKKLLAFHYATQKLVVTEIPDFESPPWKTWKETRNDLIDAIDDDRPFYPREIWEELIVCQKMCHSLSVLKDRQMLSDSNLRKEYVELPPKISAQLDKLEQAIRIRLNKFDE
jgi:hypothetical protein